MRIKNFYNLFSKKTQILLLSAVAICVLLYLAESLGLTNYFSVKIFNQRVDDALGNQIQKFDTIFKNGWWPKITDLNKAIQLGILFTILICAIVVLAINDRNLANMTIK
jgi:hypothetical protein